MKLSGEHRYPVSQERLWEALLDPHVLAGTLPGCEELEQTGENAYRGRLKMKVGPVQGIFEGTVQLENLDPPNGYDLVIDGKGAPGFMKGEGSLRLEPDGDGTILHYEIDAQVGGRIASIGQRLVESSAKVVTRQGLQGLERQLAASPAAEPSPATAPAATAATPDVAAAPTDPDEIETEDLGPVQSRRAETASPSQSKSQSPAPASRPAPPSQAELAGGFVKGLAGELVPPRHRPTLLIAFVLVTIIAVAVAMRTCGG